MTLRQARGKLLTLLKSETMQKYRSIECERESLQTTI